jgi:hypothetical protein
MYYRDLSLYQVARVVRRSNVLNHRSVVPCDVSTSRHRPVAPGLRHPSDAWVVILGDGRGEETCSLEVWG